MVPLDILEEIFPVSPLLLLGEMYVELLHWLNWSSYALLLTLIVSILLSFIPPLSLDSNIRFAYFKLKMVAYRFECLHSLVEVTDFYLGILESLVQINYLNPLWFWLLNLRISHLWLWLNVWSISNRFRVVSLHQSRWSSCLALACVSAELSASHHWGPGSPPLVCQPSFYMCSSLTSRTLSLCLASWSSRCQHWASSGLMTWPRPCYFCSLA